MFDSGLGGLTVVRNVRRRSPQADLTFLADQGRVPYGDRSDAELRRFLGENVAYLEASGADAIVMGCNTTCAVAARYGWPPAAVPILDLIESAALAVRATGLRRVGVIATKATIRSGAYGDAIRAHVDGVAVTEVAAPELVPLVEAGQLEGDEPRRAVARALEPFDSDLDLLILACTHYPLLGAHFAEILGPRVALLDPAVAQAERASALPGATRGSRALRMVTSGDARAFEASVRRILAADELAASTFASWSPPVAAVQTM